MHLAKELDDKFGEVNEEVIWDAKSLEIFEKSKGLEKLQEVKVSDDLPDVPNSKTQAWKHQRRAYWFAKGLPSCYLNMDMGTGKSKVSVDLCINLGHRKTLIICPQAVIKDVWPGEFKVHGGEPVEILALGKKVRGRKMTVVQKTEEAEGFLRLHKNKRVVIIINYEAVWREPFATFAKGCGWDCVIMDEAHKLKSAGGKISMFCGQLGKKAGHRLCLSGTMMPHSPLDVYAQFRFLEPGIFGTSYAKFKQEYAVFGGFEGRQVVAYQNEELLNKKIMDITYRVGKEVLDLPEYHHIYRKFELPPAAQKIYDDLADTFYAELEDGEVTASNALVKLLRFQQITGGFLKLDDDSIKDVHDEKRNLLLDIMECLDLREPIPIFCKFQYDMDIVKAACLEQGRTCAELSGRMNQLAEWKAGGFDCIAVQIQAGGTGVSLVRARYCVYYSLGFSLGDYEQSLSRVHRPGQKRTVTYFHLLSEGTVDEIVYNRLQSRKNVVDGILDMGLHLGGKKGKK